MLPALHQPAAQHVKRSQRAQLGREEGREGGGRDEEETLTTIGFCRNDAPIVADVYALWIKGEEFIGEKHAS